MKKERIRQLRINLDQYPSAGPRPNITGMRNLYWGVDAPLIRVGVYVYKVPLKVYNMV